MPYRVDVFVVALLLPFYNSYGVEEVTVDSISNQMDILHYRKNLPKFFSVFLYKSIFKKIPYRSSGDCFNIDFWDNTR